MAKNLVIVESPAKCKTIEKYLWKDFQVKASFGHVVDLPKKNMWIQKDKDFEPLYEVSPDKKKVIAELKKLSKSAEKVWIATDEDREWEAIWRHVANQLKLDIAKTPRIVFHEITKNAIEKAVKSPRTIDMNLVDAQQARRVLDRLVWFELSPVLRKKIKWWLSAWRVQSVSVRLIVEREKEIDKFDSKSFFKTIWDFKNSNDDIFQATLSKDFKKETDIQSFLEDSKTSEYEISEIQVKPGKKSSSAPFTTSTLQQEASRKIGFSVARTMQVAQKLYEAGLITYMRTDSVNLSNDAIKLAENQIISNYGKEYSKPTRYAWKSKWAQEAHECIRPTNLDNPIAWSNPSEKRLYDLIRKRTIASQMSDAVLEKTKAIINISNRKENFVAEWEVIKFDWFLKVYVNWEDEEISPEDKKWFLPKLNEWESLQNQQIISTQKFKKHPPRYTEASLVKELEKRGIGRPSTYAPTISTIQKRWYVVLENRPGIKKDYQEFTLKKQKITQKTKQQNTWAEKNKLFPTDIGIVVTNFLIENFENILDYWFTASVEDQFDTIAHWDLKRNQMIKDFYWPFNQEVNKVSETAERQSGERILWKDPKTWMTVLARIWRYWPMVQIWTPEEIEKPKYAGIHWWQSISTITLEEALEAFKLPKKLWEFDWKDVEYNIWRFGPYVKHDWLFVSIPKEEDWSQPIPNLETAIELIKKKQELEKNKYINEFEHEKTKIQVLNWPYWPYIKYNKKNYKIPKWWKDATDLTKKDCLEIIEWWPATKKRKTARKTKKSK